MNPAGSSLIDTEQAIDPPFKENTRKNEGLQSCHTTGITRADIGAQEGGGRIGSGGLAMVGTIGSNLADAVRITVVNLRERTKQIFGIVYGQVKVAAQKMILIPRIILFMPMDKILRPNAFWYRMERYSDARQKIHNKSSYIRRNPLDKNSLYFKLRNELLKICQKSSKSFK